MMTAATVNEERERLLRASEIVLDDEFGHMLPGLSADEKALREFELHRDGCTDPLIVWRYRGQAILLVGYEVFATLKLWKMPFQIVEKEFADRDAARWFIIQYYLPRHLSGLTAGYLRGLRYLASK